MTRPSTIFFFFFFNDTATTEIYTLSLHDALPICTLENKAASARCLQNKIPTWPNRYDFAVSVYYIVPVRSEEHTSELQSPCNLVCRLLLEKKKQSQFSHRLA